jgi:DNA mismatch repair ATPase MutS
LAIAGYFRKRTTELNQASSRIGMEVCVVREGIELISALTFHSAKLLEIQTTLSESNAASALRLLERLTNSIAECDKPYFDLPSQALIVRTQLCFAIEEWKSRHAEHLTRWLDAWAEFEVLAALSGYASEHPVDAFPQFQERRPTFVAHDLGHPLIPSQSCVRNHVSLDSSNRFYLISGSNMAGKSTLLRAIGLNAILAQCGAPVRAASLTLTKLEVFASLSLVDSLQDGRSKFLAEVDRVRQALERARSAPVLFLIDEILSGTNSKDRRLASESILRALLENGAIGALSTHDLALTEIAELDGFIGSNVHMGSRSKDDPMDFDYLLKPGVTTETNARAIVAMMGIPITA